MDKKVDDATALEKDNESGVQMLKPFMRPWLQKKIQHHNPTLSLLFTMLPRAGRHLETGASEDCNLSQNCVWNYFKSVNCRVLLWAKKLNCRPP